MAKCPQPDGPWGQGSFPCLAGQQKVLQSTGTLCNICASHALRLLPLALQGMDEDGELCSIPQEGIPLVCCCYPAEKSFRPSDELSTWPRRELALQRRTSRSLFQPPVFLPQPPPSHSTSSSRASSQMPSGCPRDSSVPMAKPGRLAAGHGRMPPLSCPRALLTARWWHCAMGVTGLPMHIPAHCPSTQHPLEEGL